MTTLYMNFSKHAVKIIDIRTLPMVYRAGFYAQSVEFMSFPCYTGRYQNSKGRLNMSNEGMANFICELRKSKQLTQKQLAEKLNITDKAVSKWERGLSYPDITILSQLAEVLGVTTGELLNGRRDDAPVPNSDILIQNTFEYAEKVTVTKRKGAGGILKLLLSVACALGIAVCVICDLAISRGLTWSLYPITSIIFAWLVIMPMLHFDSNKVAMSLVSLSVFIIPFLFCIERIYSTIKWVLPLGIPITAVSLIYLWVIFGIFAKTRISRFNITGIALLMGIPMNLVIDYIVSRFTQNSVLDAWDGISYGILVIVAICLFVIAFIRNSDQA